MPTHTKSNLFNALNKAAQTSSKVVKTVSGAEMNAFISSNATFSLLSSIFAGYPTIVRDVLKELAKYQIPAVGVPVAIITALHLLKVKHTKVPARLVKSLMGAVGMTSFFVPLMMELITRIIQIIEQEPRSSAVYISNGAAAAIIGGCTLTGLLQAMQTYFLDIKAKSPEQPAGCLSKATTSVGLRVTLGAVNVASAAHGAIMASEKIFGINTESNAAYYSRSAITLLMGMTGAMVLGGDESRSRSSTKLFLSTINIAQLYSLAIAFAGTFFLSPAAEPVFGEAVIDEQIYLWTVVIPLLVSLLMAVTSCVQKNQENDVIEEQQNLINESYDLEISDEETNSTNEYQSEACNETIDPQYKPIGSLSNIIAISKAEDKEEIFHFSPA